LVGDIYESLRPHLISWVENLRVIAELKPVSVPEDHLEDLAHSAAHQWTGQFNPRPLEVSDFRRIYEESLVKSCQES